jgi:hypothetical protein
MGNALDDFLAFQEKTAFSNPFSGMGGQMKDHATRAAATGAVTAAGAGLGAAVQHIFNAATKARDHRTMLEHNPDLEDALRENPKRFNQMFTTLRNANPSFSRDPIIAGTYMRRMMDAPMTAGGMAVEALSHKQPMSPVLDMFTKGTMEGAKAGLRASSPLHQEREMDRMTTNTRMNRQRQDLDASRMDAHNHGISPDDIY